MKALGNLALVALVGCGTSDGGHHVELRAALDRSAISLGESIGLAEQSIQYGAGVNARIFRDLDQWAVGANATDLRHDVRVDFKGVIVADAAAGPAGAGCQTQITLAEALAIAEAEAGGDAVAVVPDDDDPCMREIQVLVDATLWEVKVGPAGAVVEKELSDEEL